MIDTCTRSRAALAALTTAVTTLRDVGPWQASDAEVADLVVGLETACRSLAGVQLAVIADGIDRGLPFTTGAGTGQSAPGRWVRSLVSVNPGEAGRRAALASAVFTGPRAAELAATRDAVLAGSISTAHAQVVVTAVEQLLPPHTPAGLVDDATRVEAQTLLLDAATGGTGDYSGPDVATHQGVDPTQLAKAGLALTATLDPGHGDRLAKDEDRQHQLRTFTVTPLPSGMCHAQGLLSKAAGHALIGVLQSLSAPQPAADGTPDPRTAGMRTHDGLAAAVRLLQGQNGVLPGAHGSANRLVVSVDVHTLAAHLGITQSQRPTLTPVRVAELAGRWPLSPLAAQVMSCDADLVAVLTGPNGAPLDVADTVYPFTARQRTAITNRDRHCTFGTCTAPTAWCHVHHLQPYARGGPTTVTNGALLCGVHHRHVHAHHLTGTITSGADNGDGTVSWQSPTGTHLNPHLPPIAVGAAITALATRWHRRRAQAAASRQQTTITATDTRTRTAGDTSTGTPEDDTG